MVTPRPAWLTRRRFLLGAGTAVGVGAAAGAGVGIDRALVAGGAKAAGPTVPAVPAVEPAAQPAAPPPRQHAWTAYLAVDRQGNPTPPQFDRLLFFDVVGAPGPACARLFEAALRTLERTFAWRPSGLLFTAGWGPAYFTDVLRVAPQNPAAEARSDSVQPSRPDSHS